MSNRNRNAARRRRAAAGVAVPPAATVATAAAPLFGQVVNMTGGWEHLIDATPESAVRAACPDLNVGHLAPPAPAAADDPPAHLTASFVRELLARLVQQDRRITENAAEIDRLRRHSRSPRVGLVT